MSDLFQYAEAKRLRDEGMALAASHSPKFSERAYEALVRIARRQIHLHVDDLLAELKDDRPSSPNAMGSVWKRAIRAGIIQRSNQTRPSKDPLKHMHNMPIYFSRIYEQTNVK